jgi:hypothetical protein
MFDASAILSEAAASQFGIAVTTGDLQEAQNLRRRLYAERARLRRAGATGLDTLSVVIKPIDDTPQCEVWVVHRRRSTKPSEPYRSRALGRDEVPDLIRARGPRRPSAFLRNLLHPAVSTGPTKA